MSFHINAEDITIEDGHILKAKLPDGEGEMNDAEIDLDEHIGNDNGLSTPAPNLTRRDLALTRAPQVPSNGAERTSPRLPRMLSLQSRETTKCPCCGRS